MEDTQTSSNQNLAGVEFQPQQANSNNRRFFLGVVMSILLAAVLVGSTVYFWQKSTNEKAINSLERKIATLEGQISTRLDTDIMPRPSTNNINGGSYLKLGDINMNSNNWNVFSGSIQTSYNVNKNIQFKYPGELYLKDYSSQNSTIWLENENVSNQAASITIEIAPGQLKGSVEMEEDIRKTNIIVNGLNATKYESSRGVAYDLSNPSDENEFMSFQITFWVSDITDEEKLAGKKIIEQLVDSFQFVNK